MKVAFHAAMSQLGARTAVLRTPLVFDHVLTNEGQGYDVTSGVFRAPVAGTYLFTVSVEAGSGNRHSELSIMVRSKKHTNVLKHGTPSLFRTHGHTHTRTRTHTTPHQTKPNQSKQKS